MCGKKCFLCHVYYFLCHIFICCDFFCNRFCIFNCLFAVCSPIVCDWFFDRHIQRIFIDRCFFFFICLYNRKLWDILFPCYNDFQNLAVFCHCKFIDCLIQFSNCNRFLFLTIFIEHSLYSCVGNLSVLDYTDCSLVRFADTVCERTIFC